MKKVFLSVLVALTLCGAGYPGSGVTSGIVTNFTRLSGERPVDPYFSIRGGSPDDFYTTRLTEYVDGHGKRAANHECFARNRDVSVRWVRDRTGVAVAERVIFDPKEPPRGKHECARKCCCGTECENGFGCPCDGKSCEIFYAKTQYILKGDPDNKLHGQVGEE